MSAEQDQPAGTSSAAPDVLAQARAAIDAAEDAVALAKTALAVAAERRSGADRRERTRLVAPGRRNSDEIDNLAVLDPDTLVTVAQLAAYWGCHHNSVLYWIRTRRLPAVRRRRAWLIRAGDALLFEPRIFSSTQNRVTR